MPNEIIEHTEPNGVTTQEQTLSILLQKAMGQDTSPDLTKEQVDEVLSQQRQVKEYIHRDRERESFDSKFYLISILVFILIFAGAVLWKYPDFFPEVLSLLIGLFGGAFGGYGFGKKQ